MLTEIPISCCVADPFFAGRRRSTESVENVAARLGIHPNHLEKEWKRCIGVTTPKQLLLGLKLYYAAYLMQNAGLKLKHIARLSGFSDEHEFYRCFHSHVGVTALYYRNHHSFEDFQTVYWERMVLRKTGEITLCEEMPQNARK